MAKRVAVASIPTYLDLAQKFTSHYPASAHDIMEREPIAQAQLDMKSLSYSRQTASRIIQCIPEQPIPNQFSLLNANAISDIINGLCKAQTPNPRQLAQNESQRQTMNAKNQDPTQQFKRRQSQTKQSENRTKVKANIQKSSAKSNMSHSFILCPAGRA
jgi:hypothetical protein